jgi:rRNA maturation endonuclease Nob1
MGKKIAVNDANILIDFGDIGLLDAMTDLDLVLFTTDLVISEIQTPEHRSQILRLISEGLIQVSAFSGEEIGKIVQKQARVPRLSLADCSVWFFAVQANAIMMTGDRLLKVEAEKEGVEVHGSLWILDQMIEAKIVTKIAACNALLDLIAKNPRLPRDECEVRQAKWCG